MKKQARYKEYLFSFPGSSLGTHIWEAPPRSINRARGLNPSVVVGCCRYLMSGQSPDDTRSKAGARERETTCYFNAMVLLGISYGKDRSEELGRNGTRMLGIKIIIHCSDLIELHGPS